jgi:brefeldin A-resistance guanine nucleotide exchange factor 1
MDVAMRKYFSTFRLPGEALQVQRIMEKFSEVYWEANPTFFGTESFEEAYVLSVSLILLNQATHNRNIPASLKMTRE